MEQIALEKHYCGGSQERELWSWSDFSGEKKMHEICEEDEMATLECFKVIQDKT